MTTMTVEEAATRKRALQEQMLALLMEFQRATGTTVWGVSLEFYDVQTLGAEACRLLRSVKVEARL